MACLYLVNDKGMTIQSNFVEINNRKSSEIE